MSTSEREFTIVREFAAPRELVFKAWLDPDQMTKWWGPHNYTTPRSTIETDPRPGGKYRATMVSDESGAEYGTSGTYREIVEPERLVFTWGDPTADGSTERESVVTVTFDQTGDKTTMTFHLVAPGPLAEEDGAEDGWGQSLDRLVGFVGEL
ncbi:SRPBCC domain-containing protein [Antrihabitans sp. YC2-6]|uniref:SRPBCC family protein n=1 Tax=Antrihabitans sp. YC2-6 TaxID=2799498 RepID=UPI0018F34A97|nr:SRPBCC domain-containing protein [Antrihabitans sp. YC2-6]MBJ8344151.1 SRPBCC domain-containing protein [Antrihabitans sp. YC2-6]